MLKARLIVGFVLFFALWTSVAVYLMRIQAWSKGNFEPGLALSLTRAGKGLRLTWNPGSLPASPNAVLWISDGNRKARTDLTNAAFQKGYFLYTPSSDDVNFTLESLQTGVSASLHSVTEPCVKSLPRTTTEERVIKSCLVFKPAEPEVSRKEANQGTLNPPALSVEAATIINKPRAPPQDSAPEAISPAVDTPKVPTPDKSPTTVSLAPATPSRWARFFRKAGRAQFLRSPCYKESDDFVMAKPRRKVDPDVPDFIAEGLTQDATVTLRVSVDQKGRVTDVEPLRPLPEHRLVGLASTAARKWEFEPALSRNRPVASRLILRVTFRNPKTPGP